MTQAQKPTRDPLDPRGLIREAFVIEGVTEPDCRSIFFDWALGLPAEADAKAMIEGLVARHADQPADHPMQAVLREGLERQAAPRRRTGRRRNAAQG